MKGLKKTLGKSGIEVTRVGLGCAPLGGLYGDILEEQAHEVVRRALSLGINVIDTAPLYGYGESENRIGRAVQGWNRNDFVLATKVRRLLVPKDEGGDTSQDANWGTASPLSRFANRSHHNLRVVSVKPLSSLLRGL